MTNGISKRALELIARDAMVEGRIADGYAQLRANDASISRLRTVTREASVLLLTEYRVMEATLALTTCRTLFDTLCYELGQRIDPKVGDILVASWGYDQTNIDYYQVVAVTRSSVRIREIGAHRVGGSQGDYLRLASLSYKTLVLEWANGIPYGTPQALRDAVQSHARGMQARRGERFPLSTSENVTIILGE